MTHIKQNRIDPSTPIGLKEENEPVGEIFGRHRLYRVIRISENTNSFGLRGVWLLRRNGECWEVGVNHLNMEKVRKGAIYHVPQMHIEGARPHWEGIGEIPTRITPDAPPDVIEIAWKGATFNDFITYRSRLCTHPMEEREYRVGGGTHCMDCNAMLP